MTRQQRKLAITIPDNLRVKMLHVARQFDINKGGHYDSSGGMVVNVWCAPDDKPECWDTPITADALDYPREFAGTIQFTDLDDDTCAIEIEASPYNLDCERPKHNKPGTGEMVQCLDWIEKKTLELVRLSDLHPEIVGLKCPFCEFVLPSGELLNSMIGHTQTHGVAIDGITLSDPPYLTVNGKRYDLTPMEKFAR